jgi:Vitamin B6 photo-protection and homoeostasis
MLFLRQSKLDTCTDVVVRVRVTTSIRRRKLPILRQYTCKAAAAAATITCNCNCSLTKVYTCTKLNEKIITHQTFHNECTSRMLFTTTKHQYNYNSRFQFTTTGRTNTNTEHDNKQDQYKHYDTKQNTPSLLVVEYTSTVTPPPAPLDEDDEKSTSSLSGPMDNSLSSSSSSFQSYRYSYSYPSMVHNNDYRYTKNDPNNNSTVSNTTTQTRTWNDVRVTTSSNPTTTAQHRDRSTNVNTNGHIPLHYINQLRLLPSHVQRTGNNIVLHFLPANYPNSVSPSYGHYAFYSFLANIAGSANMVLSTQMLLVAVVVGSTGTGSIGTDLVSIDSNDIQNDLPYSEDSGHNANTISDRDTDDDASITTDTTKSGQATTPTPTSTMTTSSSLGVLAGALNWIVKDGIGQAGGIVFASHVGQSRSYDSSPRYWKMISSIIMDCASLLEIIVATIIVPSTPILVVPIACCSAALKNIAYLTSSASRAAIHQSLITKVITIPPTNTTTTDTMTSNPQQPTTVATTTKTTIPKTATSTKPYTTNVIGGGNLADVTAKSASQGMVAGLVGTTIGISLSTSILATVPELYTNNCYLVSFLALSVAQQTFNYISLRPIVVRYFNYSRLYIVLTQYITIQKQHHKQNDDDHDDDPSTPNLYKSLLSPEQVAMQESYIPFLANAKTVLRSSLTFFTNRDVTEQCIKIGDSVTNVCQDGPDQLVQIKRIMSNEKYIVNINTNTEVATTNKSTIHLLFLDGASGIDQVKGLYHALLLQQQSFDSKHVHDQSSKTSLELIRETYTIVNETFPYLIQHLHTLGWNTATEVTSIEPRNAKRIKIFSNI